MLAVVRSIVIPRSAVAVLDAERLKLKRKSPGSMGWDWRHKHTALAIRRWRGLVVTTPVAVEEIRIDENRPKIGDQKCIPGRRKAFIGHPTASIFPRNFDEGVFHSHA